MRPELARPIGKLFSAAEISGPRFTREAGRKGIVVTVGDRVTETFGAMGRPPDVQIIDSKENRAARAPPDVHHVRTLKVSNPPGTVTDEAVEGIRDALSGRKPARVLVEGEEDLLVIPAVISAPVGSSVYYGQPGVGIVVVRVTASSQRRLRALLDRMEPGRDG